MEMQVQMFVLNRVAKYSPKKVKEKGRINKKKYTMKDLVLKVYR